MHPDVEWANGMEGGHVHGRDAVREYWMRQWSVLDPHVEPLQINRNETGRYVVEVHQIVRNLEGTVLVNATVHHTYRIRNGLIERMDIE